MSTMSTMSIMPTMTRMSAASRVSASRPRFWVAAFGPAFAAAFAAAFAFSTLLAGAGRAAAADGGAVLIFCTDSDRHPKEADSVNRMRYGGRGEVLKGLPAAGILATIEDRAKGGNKVAAVEIIGHGNPSGPQITADGAPLHADDRLTVEAVNDWASRLRTAGKEPKDFFTPDATVTIRACYVGEGRLPQALLDVLPRGATVNSDNDFYKNGPLSAAIGGYWGQKRVTTHDQDYVYLKGDKGDTVPWSKRDAGRGEGYFIGSWEGTAEVSAVSGASIPKKTTFRIPPGQFVIKELDKGPKGDGKADGKAEGNADGKTLLELTFAGNVLIGEQNGAEAVFEPDKERGGNMLAAKLKLGEEGKVLTGQLRAGKDDVTVTRDLLLSRVK